MLYKTYGVPSYCLEHIVVWYNVVKQIKWNLLHILLNFGYIKHGSEKGTVYLLGISMTTMLPSMYKLLERMIKYTFLYTSIVHWILLVISGVEM